jgi:hypothetical protein
VLVVAEVLAQISAIPPLHAQDAAHKRAPIIFKQRQVCAVALRLADAVVAHRNGTGRSAAAGAPAVPVGTACKHIPFPPKLDSLSVGIMREQARTGTVSSVVWLMTVNAAVQVQLHVLFHGG